MDKRYQVFVSSTFWDLKEERAKVIATLTKLDCFPAAMEFFYATSTPPWELIKQVIDKCDYYLVIIAGRYGSEHAQLKLSFTELEFKYALSKNKPVAGFIHADPERIELGKTERVPTAARKLEAFKKLVRKNTCAPWTTADGLGLEVAVAIQKLQRDFPAAGWVPSTAAADPARENALRERIASLEADIAALRATPTTIVKNLERGTDIITFVMQYKLSHWEERKGTLVKISWDEIFVMAGRYLLTNGPSSNLHSHLDSTIGSAKLKVKFDHATMDNETFRDMVIQLHGLGLLKRNNNGGAWGLTPYGESYLTTLALRKRPKA